MGPALLPYLLPILSCTSVLVSKPNLCLCADMLQNPKLTVQHFFDKQDLVIEDCVVVQVREHTSFN